ncbi:MAG: CDP-alcohol phosphatidyltransferase family protein [Candidatus Iainarchaeum archaeon]|uniref:CDP-alcohol phosphatidyltransferase family protein n=1 Tax=Candidatus Iainarchaeum sp. TaxID=3101447 RepID=A0A7T9DJ94_9ARCH|nr:MAG: CDP-alcohol phosphatidyltransferase family protein [Candidatus Diapherotrites archaeon]
MLSQFRGILKPLFGLLAQPFIALHVHPKWVTLLGIPFAAWAGYAYLSHDWWAALILVPVAGLWDAIDGTVARAQELQSLWGNYFETMIDKVVEILIFIGLAFIAPIAAIAALGFGLLSSYAKPRAGLVIIMDNHDWPAIGEHADKFAVLWFGTLWAALHPLQGVQIMSSTLWVLVVVAIIGSVQRMMYARKLIAAAEKKGAILPYLKAGKER